MLLPFGYINADPYRQPALQPALNNFFRRCCVVSSRNFRTSVGNIKIATKYKSNLCALFPYHFCAYICMHRCVYVYACVSVFAVYVSAAWVAYKNAFKIAVESMKNAC